MICISNHSMGPFNEVANLKILNGQWYNWEWEVRNCCVFVINNCDFANIDSVIIVEGTHLYRYVFHMYFLERGANIKYNGVFGLCVSIKNSSFLPHTTSHMPRWFLWDLIFIFEASAVNFHLKRHNTALHLYQPANCMQPAQSRSFVNTLAC